MVQNVAGKPTELEARPKLPPEHPYSEEAELRNVDYLKGLLNGEAYEIDTLDPKAKKK